jgi:hypothetical protein
MLKAARAKYYSLEQQGFQSATCQMHFDLSTLPVLQEKDAEEDRKGLAAMHFFLHLDSRRQPWVQVVYPDGTSNDAKPFYARYAENLQSIATGFFNTWPSKGLNGPIPPFDTQVESIATTESGYSLLLRVPGGPVQLEMDKNYIVKKIFSTERNIEEKPIYASSPDGLIFAGNAMTGDMEQSGAMSVSYEIESKLVDGLHLPAAVHLQVNQTMDVRFTLSDCAVTKGKVIELKVP